MPKIPKTRHDIYKIANDFFELLQSLFVIFGFLVTILIDVLIGLLFETKIGRVVFTALAIWLICVLLKHC